MTYQELQRAVAVFRLDGRATAAEIRRRHRELVRAHHPDAAGGAESEEIRQVNEAYRVLLDYLAGYRFSFAEEEFYEQNPDERLRRQFMDDPLWGSR